MSRISNPILMFTVAILFTGCTPPARGHSAESQSIQQTLSVANQAEPDLSTALKNCPVTKPSAGTVQLTAGYPDRPADETSLWYGSAALWTALPVDGVWADLPLDTNGYTQKTFWWREGYTVTTEPQPALTVTGRRLDDDSAAPLVAYPATNASAADIGDAMLVGVIFPTPGCWEITAEYAGERLSFVTWVAP